MSPPQRIGRYLVQRRLGSGAFAVVWLAQDERLQAPVAVKVLADNWAGRLDIRERFLSEARLLRQAGSGGVVQVYDIGELEDDRPYFVMEYADAGTVEDLLTAGPPPLAEALRLVAGAATGVAALHAAGIVHRDIKPSNVLLKSPGGPGPVRAGTERVLVADLGLAKNLAASSGLTVVAGSAGYMAPEQSDPPPGGIDARVDVYGLGALLYHLVTGTVPGPPGRVLPPTALIPGLPAPVEALALRALAPAPDDRPPHAADFARELEAVRSQVAEVTEAAVREPKTGPVREVRATPSPSPGATPTPVPPERAPAQETPARRTRLRPRHLLVTLTVLALAAAGTALAIRESGGSGGDAGSGKSAATRRIADATGALRLSVPAAWAREYADGGWDPAAIGLPSAKEPGLTVATKVSDWSDPDSGVNGVFAGAVDLGTKDAASLTAAVEALRHSGCREPSEEEWDEGEWKGVVRTWTGCAGHRLAEIALTPRNPKGPEGSRDPKDSEGSPDPKGSQGSRDPEDTSTAKAAGTRGAYVQIRCAEDGDDCDGVTKKVLSGLELAPAGKSTERP
ncbi:serine/threonine-protein kinase [Streptomyces sp. P6-2-1]|uniref:serine/threonine-protein kinase n=1 Tax=Streptomyces sp. P6-2-1 TaxID=3422591 RepID=UPI003D36C77D